MFRKESVEMEPVIERDQVCPKPKVVTKLIAEERAGVSGLSDSGLADSRNVTFSPNTKVVEFSPLMEHQCNDLEKSVMVPTGLDADSETTLDITTEEGNEEGPFQSSGLAGAQLNIADMSTIHRGIWCLSTS